MRSIVNQSGPRCYHPASPARQPGGPRVKMSGRLRYVQLARLVWRLPTYARVVWGLMRDPRTPLPLKGLLAAGLAYVVMPLDLIPDAIPIIGQADDITVLLLVLDLFIANAPEAVREEQIARARNGTAQLDQDLARLREAAGDAVRPDPRPPAGAAGALRRPAGLAGGEGDAARLAHAPAARAPPLPPRPRTRPWPSRAPNRRRYSTNTARSKERERR